MDADIILNKLESLRRCVSRIEEKTPSSAESLKSDYDLQDIISLNLERAVQIAVDIASHVHSELDTKTPATMGESFVSLADAEVISRELAEQLRKSVGFRNISVHEYEKIDWEIVFSICTKNMANFRGFAAAVLDFFGFS